MLEIPNGKPVRAYLASDDISTAAELAFKDMDGNAVALTAGRRLLITDIQLNNGGTASVITLFQDHDTDNSLDSGEELYAASLAANGQNSANLHLPIACRRFNSAGSNGIHAVASAASSGTRIVILGVIVNS